MVSVVQFALDLVRSDIRYRIIITVCLTLIYGVYLCLVPIAVHLMVNNGLQSQTRKWLLAITTSMFALSTVDWILSVDYTFQFVDLLNNSVSACYGKDDASACLLDKLGADFMSPQLLSWLLMFDNILFVNYIFADCILVWRAWVLCSDQSRVVLMIPVIMLVINTIVYLVLAVGTAILLISKEKGGWVHDFNIFIEGIQFTHQALSLLINIFVTSIIALKAWKYRKFLMESGMGIRTPTKAIRVLVLLVESGVVYILIGVMVLASLIISLLTGRKDIPSVFLHVGMQLVGMYPIVVIILVELNRSLDTTFSSFGTIIDVRGDRTSQVVPMTFVPRPVLASGGQIEPATKPSDTDTHRVTSNYTLEPGDAGMISGNRDCKVSREGACDTDSYLSSLV